MKINEVQRPEAKTVTMTIRTYPSYSKWMKDNKVSPARVFNKALEELMEKIQNENKTN